MSTRASRPSSWSLTPVLRAVAALSIAVVVALATLGCERDGAPPLVDVHEVSPREVETGDRLEVRGTGFPQGRAARITLRGTVHRAGEGTSRAVVELHGVVATPDRVDVAVTEDAIDKLCGRADRAGHATFVGDVEVGFSPTAPAGGTTPTSATALSATLHGVALDVRPASLRASVAASRTAEGARVLEFLGVSAGQPTPRGLPIEQVRAGSIAELAGIEAGDVLLAVDSVHVLALADVVPSSARSVRWLVRRGETSAAELRTLSMIGYAGERIPTEFGPALLIVGLAIAVLALLVMPGPRALALFELRVASRLRNVTFSTLLQDLAGRGWHGAVLAITSALLATFALGPHVIGPDVDAAVLTMVAITSLVASRVIAVRGARAIARMLFAAGACATILGGVVLVAFVQAGGLQLSDVVRSQGGAPWEAHALQSPVALVLVCTYVAALVVLLRLRGNGNGDDASPRFAKGTTGHARLLERVGLLVASAVAVALFFGGWQVPGVVEVRSAPLQLAGAALFMAKTWALAAASLAAAGLASALEPKDVQGVVAKRLVPAVVLAMGLVFAMRRLPSSPLVLERACGAAVLAVLALAGLRSVVRVRAALARPAPHASPFL